jgi:hypothetical protein
MGTIGVKNKENIKYSEESIQRALRYNFLSPSSVKYFTENLNIFDWESDVIKFTKSGYVYEFEIKISKADFKNDFKHKKKKHLLLEDSNNEIKNRPNYFYYVVPDGLISAEDVPEYAGLLYINSTMVGNGAPYHHFIEIKKAPSLHKNKFDFENSNLMDKFYYNYIHWKQKHETDMENYKNLLEEVRTCEGKTYNYTLPQAVERIKELEKNIQNYLERSEEYKKLAQEEIRIQRRLQKKLRELGVSSDEVEEIMGVRCVIND